MHRKFICILTAVAVTLGISIHAAADTTPEDAADYRTAIMTTLRGHLVAASMAVRGLVEDNGHLVDHAHGIAHVIVFIGRRQGEAGGIDDALGQEALLGPGPVVGPLIHAPVPVVVRERMASALTEGIVLVVLDNGRDAVLRVDAVPGSVVVVESLVATEVHMTRYEVRAAASAATEVVVFEGLRAATGLIGASPWSGQKCPAQQVAAGALVGV